MLLIILVQNRTSLASSRLDCFHQLAERLIRPLSTITDDVYSWSN